LEAAQEYTEFKLLAEDYAAVMPRLCQPSGMNTRKVSGIVGDETAVLVGSALEDILIRQAFLPRLPDTDDVEAAQSQGMGCGHSDIGVQEEARRPGFISWQGHCP